MNSRKATIDRTTRMRELRRACKWSRPVGDRYSTVIVLISVLLGIIAIIPSTSRSQTLDEAVNAQLERITINPNNPDEPCGRLFSAGGDPAPGSGLFAICNRQLRPPGPPGPSPSSAAAGGGAATPTRLPGIVIKRIKGERDEDESKKTTALLASASSPAISTDADIELGKVLGLFISGEYESLDRDETTFASGYNSSIGRLIVGADVQITDRILAGLAFDTSKQNGDFHGSAGDFEIKSYGILAFGSFLPFNEAFMQVYGGYTYISNDRTRIAAFTEVDPNTGEVTDPAVLPVTGTPDADYDTDQYSAGILIGYDFPVRGFTIGPRAGLDWVKNDIDSYREKGDSGLELRFDDDDVESLQSTVGLMGSAAFSTDFGVVVPQTSILWKHEFDDDSRDIDVSFVDDLRSTQFSFETDSPDRDFFEVNAGLSLVLPHGVQTFMNFRALLGHRYYDSYAGTMGLRIQI